MGITGMFCGILGRINAESLSPSAIAAARTLILDGIAVGVAGSRESAPRILAAHLRELGGAEQATAINFAFRTSVVSAAYLNGASMHVLDYEPMWNPPNHATSTTLPAVLALAELTGASVRWSLLSRWSRASRRKGVCAWHRANMNRANWCSIRRAWSV